MVSFRKQGWRYLDPKARNGEKIKDKKNLQKNLNSTKFIEKEMRWKKEIVKKFVKKIRQNTIGTGQKNTKDKESRA